MHITEDAERVFILADHASPANRPDCKEMMAVVGKCGLEEGSPVFSDKGCYGQEYSKALLDEGLLDGIMYTAFKNGHCQRQSERLTGP